MVGFCCHGVVDVGDYCPSSAHQHTDATGQSIAFGAAQTNLAPCAVLVFGHVVCLLHQPMVCNHGLFAIDLHASERGSGSSGRVDGFGVFEQCVRFGALRHVVAARHVALKIVVVWFCGDDVGHSSDVRQRRTLAICGAVFECDGVFSVWWFDSSGGVCLCQHSGTDAAIGRRQHGLDTAVVGFGAILFAAIDGRLGVLDRHLATCMGVVCVIRQLRLLAQSPHSRLD